MAHPTGEKHQCQAFTLKNSQCRNKCIEKYCKIHDPKECEKRKNIRRLYKEIEERNYKFLKYVERECKKARIRHRKCIERIEKKKNYANIQCKATTKVGLPCKISTKSEYCHVHKHLDTKSVNVEKLIEKEPEDDSIMISFRKEMEDEYRKIIPRSYTGPELDSDKMEKINGIYLSEMKRKLNIYGRIINNLVNEPDVKLNIDDINDIKKETEESITGVYQKTNEAINSIKKANKKSKRTKKSPYYSMASFIKIIEDESHDVEIRSYTGPELDPYNAKKVERAYISEKQSKDEMYIGILRMLSCYSDFDEIDPVDVRKDMDASLKILTKKTNEIVKSFVAASKRANHSK
ncbi:hypothetical protein VKS41_009398 [Umbelopsis sp. WA50703]